MTTQLRCGVKFGGFVRKSFMASAMKEELNRCIKLLTQSYRKNEVGISDSIFLRPLMHGERTLT